METNDFKELKSLFESSDSLSLTGNLREICLPRIFYFLKYDLKDGILSIKSGNSKKIISFEKGNPRFAISNIVEECLGRLFVAKGKISEEECEESLSRISKHSKKQGEILIEMGLLEPFEIDEALKEQARERVIELLSWQDGEYSFTPKMALRKDLIPIDIEVPQIVLLGIRRYYNLGFLRLHLDKWLDHLPIVEENHLFNLESFKFASWEAKTVKYFDGSLSLRSILNKKITREIDAYHLVFALGSLEVLRFRDIEGEKKEKVKALNAAKRSELWVKYENIRRKQQAIELTKDFVIGETKKPLKPKKIYLLKRTPLILAIVLSFLILLFMFSVFRNDNSDFALPGVVKSGNLSDGTVTLICEDDWNSDRDKDVTESTIKDIYNKKLKLKGHRKIKLSDSSGKILGIGMASDGDNFHVIVY